MNIKNIWTVAILSAAAMTATAGSVDESGLYAGSIIGSSHNTLQGVKWSSTSYGVDIGFKASRYLSYEFAYLNLGNSTATLKDIGSAQLKASEYQLSVLGTYPVTDQFGIYGRLGLARASSTANGPGGRAHGSSSGLIFGAGLSYSLTPALSGRVELQRPTGDITSVLASLQYRF